MLQHHFAEIWRSIFIAVLLLSAAVFVLACAWIWLFSKVCRNEGRTDGQVDAIHRDLFWLKTETRRGKPSSSEVPEERPKPDDQLPESGFFDGDSWKLR